MKKLIIFILVIVCLFSLNYFSESTLGERFLDDAICYYAYVNNLDNIDCAKYEVVQNGNGAIIKTGVNNSKEILISGCSVAGECVELVKDFGIDNIIKKLNLKVVSSDSVNGRLVLTGYSNLLPTYLTSENNKINIQVAETLQGYLVGYPLILHSY